MYSSLRTLFPPYASPLLTSSRFAQTSAPPRCAVSRASRCTGLGPKVRGWRGNSCSFTGPLLAGRWGTGAILYTPASLRSPSEGVPQRPAAHARTEVPSGAVVERGVDAGVDTAEPRLPLSAPEAAEGAGHPGQGRRGDRQRRTAPVPRREDGGRSRADRAVRPGVGRVGRGRRQRRSGRVGRRQRVAVATGVPDGGHRSPQAV